ncbi:MAG: hypothetical protein JXO51_04490 [Candidatus Aminicenantes bacterium]|nr:hypothetical protein [Candidatus Aminicenantes bacterium]
MDAKQFREVERLYKDLRERQAAGEISAEDMKAELKKMMIRDEENRYWMLGGKTGGWYVYDGTSWNADDPYHHEATPLVLRPETEMAEKEESRPAPEGGGEGVAPSETLCRFCHSRMNEHDVYCRFCGASQKAAAPAPARRAVADELQVKAVRLLAFARFFGGLGLVLGVVFGATFGIFNILGDLIYQFPVMVQEMRGKFQGGLFFGAVGGIAGFAAMALLGVLLGLFYNALAFVFGGLRFRVKS